MSELEDQLQYFQTILQYLDTSGNLSLIKAQCEKYSKTKSLVFMFKLLIDPADLCEANANLGNLLLQDSVSLSNLFQQVVYKTVTVLELLPGEVTLSQVAVILRLTHLPTFHNVNTIHSASCLTRVFDLGSFCRLKGVVIGLSAPTKYTLSTRYHCPDEDCEGFHGNHYIRVHAPGASETQTVRKDFKCAFCYCTLAEDKSRRTLSERLVAEVVPDHVISLPGHESERARLQAIPVYIRDDLTRLVEIGEVYEIIGRTRKDIQEDRITISIEANNIKKVKMGISTRQLLQETPRNILKLYRDRQKSPWSFVLTLAYLFGGGICPVGSYFHLKLVLLLSLMSRLDHKTKPLHILAVGGDVEMISRLLHFGLRFLDNTTSLTAGQSVTGHITQDKYSSASYFVEGGVLHHAQNGLCYVGDVNRLKTSAQQKLQSALSGGKVVTDVGSKFTGGLPHHMEQPLRARVWGYADPTPPKKTQQVLSDELFVTCKTGDTQPAILESFSIVCFSDCADSTSSEAVQAQTMEMTLVAAMLNDLTFSLPITAFDMIQFIKFASRLRPRFKLEAEGLIHSYYLSSRKSRSKAGDSTDVPVNADQTILSLAYSHAKLALQNEVTLNDALMAIYIYEQYLTARFGFSNLSIQPIPHITTELLNYCLGPENDKRMEKFHASLLRYCSLTSSLEE